MTSYLIDVNVWLAITWEQHAQHASALRWYSSIDREGLWFCRITMLGMLRLLTNQKVMGDDTMTMAAAWGVYDEWKQDPRVDLVTEPAGIESLFRLATAPLAKLTASNAVSDCYLVGFAEAAGAHLVTFDRGLARTARFRKVPVALLDPA